MNQVYLDIIIFAVIAIFLFFKLRNSLGQVNENDQSSTPLSTKKSEKTPSRRRSGALIDPQTGEEEWPSILPDFTLVKNATVHNQLLALHEINNKFNPYHFIQGAERAFEMILEAFARGDKTTLENLLEKELYQTYAQMIDQREKKAEVYHHELIRLETVLISDVELTSKQALLTVNFKGKEKIAHRDKNGEYVDDRKGQVEETENQWVFVKEIKNQSKKWLLSDVKEVDHA